MVPATLAARYALHEKLGAGGMGVVYRATDLQTGQVVAIKQLKGDLAEPQIIERFKREGEALRDLNHPNIVKMIDALEHDGQHYLVMEYVPGGDLKTLLEQKGKFTPQHCVDMAIDLADALTRAHRLNILHRDLKPGNMMVATDGTLRLTDFGVARVGSKERVTGSGAIVGTIDYLPPEIFAGQPFDARGDIWAFGIILFEMLSGAPPFRSQTLMETIHAITTRPLPDLAGLCPEAPKELIDLVAVMLERNPLARIRSVRHVGAVLEDIQRERGSGQHTAYGITGVDVHEKHPLPTPTMSSVSLYQQQLAGLVAQLETALAGETIGSLRRNLEHMQQFSQQWIEQLDQLAALLQTAALLTAELQRKNPRP